MSMNYLALYQDLVSDLQEYLPADVVDEESAALASWYPGMTLTQFRALTLAKTFFKKLEDRSSNEADGAALRSFVSSNERCNHWSLRFESSADELLYGSFVDKLHRFWWRKGNEPLFSNVSDILDVADCGPGASLKSYGNDYYTKLFSGPLSTTKVGLYDAYDHYLNQLPLSSDAERHRYEEFGEPLVVRGNRLSFVPKNATQSRCICTEPLLNGYFQQGIRYFLEGRLKEVFSIDLSTQPDFNRELARVGSAEDSYVTIDLSCASDSVSLRMCEQVLPASMFRWLDFVRSPEVEYPNGISVPLHMISSMGNATTFPLQTIIFSCVVSAVYESLGIDLVRNAPTPSVRKHKVTSVGNFGVFGDDIVVVKRAAGTVVRLLSILGFNVNVEKSFFEGPFRESCGGDYFEGSPARGVYIKSLTTLASRYVAINRLNEWSGGSGIMLPKTIHRLCKKVRFLPVPLEESDDAGVKVPFEIARLYIPRLVEFDDANSNCSYAYKRHETESKVMRIKDGDIRTPRSARDRIYNAPGLLEAFLRGDIRSDTLSIRLGTPRYRTKVAVALNWDYMPTVGRSKNWPVSQARFASAISANLPGWMKTPGS